jgi:hypothetical protein
MRLLAAMRTTVPLAVLVLLLTVAAHPTRAANCCSEAMAKIVAAHLIRHLETSGFVLMKRLASQQPNDAYGLKRRRNGQTPPFNPT